MDKTNFLDFRCFSGLCQAAVLWRKADQQDMLCRYPTLSLLIHPGGWLRRDKVGWATGCAFSHFCESVPLSQARTPSSTSFSSVAGALSCSSKGNDEGGTVARGNKGRRRNLSTVGKDTGLAVEGFVPKFYLLNAQNAESYANKNPNPAELKEVDRNRKIAVILHGILGTGRNWVPFTRKLLSHFPSWQFILVDQRGHGASHTFPGSNDNGHTVDSCARDLDNLCMALGCAPEVVIGHSFGGKVALHFHMMTAHPPAHTWILDSHLATFDIKTLMRNVKEEEEEGTSPMSAKVSLGRRVGEPEVEHDEQEEEAEALEGGADGGKHAKATINVCKGGGGGVDIKEGMRPGASTDIISVLESIPSPIQSRAVVAEYLTEHGYSKTTTQWLLSNLKASESDADKKERKKKKERTLEWRFNLDISRALIIDASRTDSLPLLAKGFRKDGRGRVGIVRGLDGIRWADAQLARYQGCIKNSGRVQEYVIKADHWIHVMKPDELVAIMAPSFKFSFGELDIDGDGLITKSEYEKGFNEMERAKVRSNFDV